jgi:molecular chaperone IbpA
MTQFDLTPFHRSTVGFDSLFDELENRFFTNTVQNGSSYPPYNIVKVDESKYAIELALAGFDREDVDIEIDQGDLVISGNTEDKNDIDARTYMHRGIAGRAFKRVFKLADHVEVRGAEMKNGILTVSLEKEIPEALKPRKIEVLEAK